MQARRDAQQAYTASSTGWVDETAKAWKRAQLARSKPVASHSMFDGVKFELMGDEVMENKILASRLALRLLDFVSWELNDLRLRIQSLEKIVELSKYDILRPEVLSEKMVEHWTAAGLSRETWMAVQDLIHSRMADHLLKAYHAANEFLVQNQVMAEIDLRPLVKRTPSADIGRQARTGDSLAVPPGDAARAKGARDAETARPLQSPQTANAQVEPTQRASVGPATESARRLFPRGAAGRGGASDAGGQNLTGGSPDDETRMQTSATPMGRARMKAQGVMGQLKRMLSNQVDGFDDTRAAHPSPQLTQAIAAIAAESERGPLFAAAPDQVFGSAHVEQAAGVLRQQTNSLKRAASSSSEKATIEVVALMFQSILAEERIPPTIRVWFARLQMPVLRVAISEPEFFGSLQHPTRRLIDRMGSCVMGFDADISDGALEVEIKRVVQVIEQYPETGRRVFQLVYDEFQKFLSKYLSEHGSAARVVSVAQQVEQKETMAIQYTIEMRSMLNDMPVRDQIREFLFKVWAETLAIAAVRNGPQHEETLSLKRAAADLVWAASAKPNRVDRAKVITDLPRLLQRLRSGMSMLGLDTKTQDEHIRVISNTLADAFMSKTEVISVERIEAMAKRLTNLEDYLFDEDVGDLPLDTASLVMMIGIDASDIEVITDGGSQPSEAMRAWAEELQLGAWFSLDHNSRISHVQFAWRSDRRQLHLFASADGHNFLIQSRRLAAYLQSGLLVPTEEEALTVRATRHALAKLDANPERLLA